MEFDLSMVYTAVNARELKPGDKVIVADDLAALKQRVEEYDGDIDAYIIKQILNENAASRFDVLDYEYGVWRGTWLLVYLLERKDNCTNCDCVVCAERNWAVDRGIGRVYYCPKHKPKTEPKAEKHTDYNHCEEAKKAYAHAMTNACPNKHYRPFRDTDELIKVWGEKEKKAWGYNWLDNKQPMPLIWVREKGCDKSADLITCFGSKGITVRGKGMYFDTLFTMFEFLDGTPCGVEE